MRVGVRVDAGPLIGGGHAMRCLTLADALRERDAEVIFVTAMMPDTIAERITAAGHRLERIARSHELDREGSRWHEPPLSEQAQRADATATGERLSAVDWMIVDHYLLDAGWHSLARTFAKKIMVIDDLANRTYECDLLLDQTFGREPRAYASCVPTSACVLTGASYALLRREFGKERTSALRRRRSPAPVQRVFIAMGTTDLGGVTVMAFEAVRSTAPAAIVDIVLTSSAPSVSRLSDMAATNPNLALHVDCANMAALMRDADLAIGAAGTTSWERCCLGLPTLLMVVAENQRGTATALAHCSAAIMLNDAAEVAPALRTLLGNSATLAKMSAAAFAMLDGRGAARVVARMLNEPKLRSTDLRLRAARDSDSETLWLWRNDPVMRDMAKNSKPIAWSDHERWFEAAMRNPDTRLYMAELPDEAAAMVRFDRENGYAVVSINVAPPLRGQGIGTAVLSEACEAYASHHPEIPLAAEIRHSNEASKLAFRAAGFAPAQSRSDDFTLFVRPPRSGRSAAVLR